MWDSDLLQSWGEDLLPAQEWLNRFQIIRKNQDLDPEEHINADKVTSEQVFTEKVKNLQSVRKRKKPPSSPMDLIEYTMEGNILSVESESSMDQLGKAILMIDNTLIQASRRIR